MPHPQRIETVHVEQLDDELCIYDWQREEVHTLNSTAGLVWQLCDGRTSPARIADQLQAQLDTPHTEELVWLTLKRLEKAHLLQTTVVVPTDRPILTRRALLKGLGVAAAMLPVVRSIIAPASVAAQSPLQTAGTWRPVSLSQGCAAADGTFDGLTLSDTQLNADASALCGGGAINAVVQNTNITDCASCFNAAVNAGANWYRFGASSVGLCQAHSCTSSGVSARRYAR